MVTAEKLVELGIIALQKAFKKHEALGNAGLKEVQKNLHGDTSLVGDMGCEKVIIDTFREANVPLRIISEEHGRVDLSDDPQFLAVLDGLDGTKEYKQNRGKGRYATMFAIFSCVDPEYNDYLFCGVMEHSTDSLFFASKNSGSFALYGEKKEKIHCSNMVSLTMSETRIYADEEFDKARNISLINDVFISRLQGYNFFHEPSSAVHYVDLARGDADLVLECTRKGNLEIATAFGLVREAGGVIVTINGESIARKKYLKLGQEEHIPMISASTMHLAKELIKKIDQSKE